MMRSVIPMKTAKIGYIVISILFCVLGGVLLARPETSVPWIGRLLGIGMIVFGLIKLVGYFSKDLFRLAFQYDLSFGVLLIVLAIVLACIATSLSFGTRIMASQRAIANADTLASTVNTSISDVLRTSSTVPAIGADGGSVTFTQDFVSPSRAKGSYTISPASDGTLQIADASGDSGAFLPSGVYVDGDHVSVTFAAGDAAAGKATTQVTTTVVSAQGDVLSTQTSNVETLGGGA